MSMSRWIWFGFATLVVAAVVFLLNTPRAVPVDVATAHRGAIRSYVEERAKTRLPEIYKITMPLQGRVLPISVKEGERVSAGQVVAQLEAIDLETELTEAVNNVAQVNKAVEMLDNSIQQAMLTALASKAKSVFSEEQFQRKKEAAAQQAASEAEKDEAELAMLESGYDLRKDELDYANYTMYKTVIELYRQTQKAKEVRAQRDYDRAVIKSPVDGVVLARNVSNERVLSAGEVLLEIGDLGQMEVEVEVLTQYAVEIQLGDAVDIEGPAVGKRPVKGRVARIFPQGFTKLSSLGVEQQRVTVIVGIEPGEVAALADADIQLGADYRIRVKIYTDQKHDVVIIPRSALFRSTSGGWQAFVVHQSMAQLTNLEIGLANDFEVEVISGLNEGDSVIVAPESSLRDGQSVEVHPGAGATVGTDKL